MHPLPPPPPYIPSPLEQSKPSPFQIIPSKKSNTNHQNSTSENALVITKLRARDHHQPILRQPRKTNPLIWFLAILCLVFSLLLIFFGITTIIVFVAIKPKNPVFDTQAASLSVIYFDSLQFLNNDLTVIANFSNPNKKLEINFEYLDIELYFLENLIATQVIRPFSQRPGEVRLIPVHLLSSLVYLPPNLALHLQKQESRNRVVYDIKGNFRVRANMGLVHYSYWLHGKCWIEMTSPPNGVMLSHSCKTKR
ncbi:late embryogenesis abundant protein [Striga asiatica]|uniref:Late embryogenesis abundant protein n=1 Tax=Striga asiatica TaxID=4170 RepID=A0A5A7QNA6_STRAF|nr:late embryogenesis abundant protein [Striga asiatica]